MSRVALIAALEMEVKPLVRGSAWRYSSPARHVHVWTSEGAVVACAGMGAVRATLAVQATLAADSAASVDALISVGWAGACAPGMKIGDVVRPSTVIDAKTGERWASAEGDGSVLATVADFAGSAEKLRLRQSYNASLVEMEAATVARLAQAHGLPFRAVRVVSDAAEFDLPALSNFYSADGQFRQAAFALHAAVRPWLWPAVMQMGRSSKIAAERLRAELARLLAS